MSQKGSLQALHHDAAERERAGRRVKVFVPGTIVRGLAEARCHVLDISCSGARAHSDLRLGAGDHVEVEARGVRAAGVVRWTQGTRFGMAFHKPLSLDAVERVAASDRIGLVPA